MPTMVVSQCTFPEVSLEATLAWFVELGFARVEAFSDWTASRLDYRAEPAGYLQQAAACGLRFHSLHLPALAQRNVDDEVALSDCLAAIAFAGRMSMKVVYLRSRTAEALVRHAPRLLDACDQAGVTALLEPHDHTPAYDLSSTRTLLDRINDKRLNVVLELGHLVRGGDDWRAFYDAWSGPVHLGGRIASVHLKNAYADGSWAPWRKGLVDMEAVLDRLATDRFVGDLVYECELGDHEATRQDLRDLRQHVEQVFAEPSPAEGAAGPRG